MSRRVRTAWGRMVACRPMRPLVPLITAAALALAGWLAAGIVTVRSVHPPARIGLLPPLWTPVLLLVALLVVEGVGRLRASRAPSRRLVAVAALVAPVFLPWLPVPLPVALLVWTGPLALGWWLASIAYVYANACASGRVEAGQQGEAEASERRRSHVVAPMLAAVVTGIALAATIWHTAPQHPKGDEPDYLVITQSLILDRDLTIENNHARADYAAYHPDPLPPSYLQRGTDGAIYSVHAPGLPVLLVPAFALAGYPGAVATLVLFAMAGAWLAWRAGWEVTRDTRASWFGVLATLGAAPFFLHGAAIFPDAPASVLALFVVWMLLRAAPLPPAAVAIALGVLPWLHTRYAVLSVGLGAVVLFRLWKTAGPSRLAAFVTPAALLALTWFGYFLVIYGTPNPSAPYGAYTQMALAHLRPGLPGLLVDQQFGLLASAPVLGLALVALRARVRTEAPRVWLVAVVVVGLCLAYTCVVAAYRMWWGGLSAPARFLVPLVLPLAPLIALAWHSLRTRASRHVAVALLVLSLGFTAMLVLVDEGALAYNVRDGRAHWAVWASPLADLVAALPAAHRDAPGIVVRDALVWLAGLGVVWGVCRGFETRGRLSPLVTYLAIAACVPAASATVWATRRVSGLAPALSQVRYLERRASSPSATLMTITPPPVGRTRTWFDVELESPRARAASDFTLLRLDRLPPGRYRVFSTAAAPGARAGVTLGDARVSRFLAELEPSAANGAATFTLGVPVRGLVVKGSREAATATGRTWIQADEIWNMPAVPPATRSHPVGEDVWLLPEDGIYPEPGGAWLAGNAGVTLGLLSSAPQRIALRAGGASVVVSWDGAERGEARLASGETRVVTMAPARGRLRLTTRGGFRPSESDSGSGDQRFLGAWIAPPDPRGH
jgi:hypothetical protein